MHSKNQFWLFAYKPELHFCAHKKKRNCSTKLFELLKNIHTSSKILKASQNYVKILPCMKNLLLWGIVIYGCVYDRVRDRGSEGGEGALLKVNVFGDSQCLALDGSAGLTIFSIISQSNWIRRNTKRIMPVFLHSYKFNPRCNTIKIYLDSNVLPYLIEIASWHNREIYMEESV